MEPTKLSPRIGLTFDDILLVPGYSDFSRSDINLSTQLTKRIKLSLPLVSSPMDTVTESNLAIALAELGGIGIIHRNLSIENQAKEVLKVKSKKLLVGAAIGVNKGFEDRAEALIKAGTDLLVLDSAHGFTKIMISAIKFIKKNYKKVDVIAGNIATADGAKALIKAGADGLRVGMGPGAICTTRIISGMGMPQTTAIIETSKIAKKFGVPVIADGGIKYSGDMIKALAVGASTIMMGGFFSSCIESPGRVIALRREFVPKRFLNVLSNNLLLDSAEKLKSKRKNNMTVTEENKRSMTSEVFYFKEYRGMGSEAAMQEGARIKSEDEYHGKSYRDRVLVAEGVEGLVPIKGKVSDLVDQAIGGIKSGMYYVGARNIRELQKKAKFIQITQASLTESHPHDIFVTNPGKNYT